MLPEINPDIDNFIWILSLPFTLIIQILHWFNTYYDSNFYLIHLYLLRYFFHKAFKWIKHSINCEYSIMLWSYACVWSENLYVIPWNNHYMFEFILTTRICLILCLSSSIGPSSTFPETFTFYPSLITFALWSPL